ncbi:hypothetical protein BJ138DRAFT_116876 [Hygrophoropsis aurantiaca]|uniref:Uncharacterized protein n=1 Tax=Hygrophoropsis aurantiaca TaxID=72124 RepID=A0ACB8AB85_9AGAM|nr:hypothetical protein BJ138DRAFT_116876 [Hygrophoropsis aurantiaca]
MFWLPISFAVGIFCLPCLAWSWSPQSAQIDHNEAGNAYSVRQSLTDNGNGLTREEVDSLFTNTDALEAYARKSDCFQNAASSLRMRCAESHMGEDERVQAAIAMTLCELATARHHAPPMECAEFSDGLVPSSHRYIHETQGACVEALSRSAQFWSSYSGYLREIPQLCFTFRRWIDIDAAKDIYRNVTLEKIALIRIILEREKISKASVQGWEQSLSGFREDLSSLRMISESIQEASNLLVVDYGQKLQSFSNEVENILTDIQTRHQDSHLQLTAKVHDTLDGIYLHHSKSLSEMLYVFQKTTFAELDSIFSFVADQNQRYLQTTDYIHQRWAAFDTGIKFMHNSIEDLTSSVVRTSDILELSFDRAQVAHRIQQEASDAVYQLVDVISQLTATTHGELQAINQTAFMVKANMQPDTIAHWMRIGYSAISQLLWPGFSLADSWLSPQSVHLGVGMATALWRLLELCFSLLTSIFFVFNIKHIFPSVLGSSATSRKPTPFSPIPHSHHTEEFACSLRSSDTVPTQHQSPQDPRIIRQLSRPRISRIPDRLCQRSAHSLWN